MRGDRPPAFQFYASDWLADVNVCCMTNEERGVYITLLCHCWIEESLPADPEDLSMLVRMSPTKFSRSWERILKERFYERGDGRISHRRLDAERDKRRKFIDEMSSAGKRGAVARWKPRDSQANGQAIETPMASDSSPISDLRSPKDQVAAPPRRAVSLEAQKVAERLGAAIGSHMPECRELKNPDTFGRWARDIDLAMRIDGRAEADLIKVIEWCHLSPDGAFWRGNVLSGRKLREKYDTIAAQMARPKANGTGPHVVMVPTTGKNIPRDLPPDKRIGELDAKTAVGELMLRLRYEPQGGK